MHYFRCQTKHRLTGETRLSATAGKLVVTGTDHHFIFILNTFTVYELS